MTGSLGWFLFLVILARVMYPLSTVLNGRLARSGSAIAIAGISWSMR